MREDFRQVSTKVDSLAGKVDALGGDKVDSLAAKLDNLGADLRSDMHSLRADVASDLLTLEKRLNDQLVALRRSVMEYHSTAVGHGLLYSELEERVRRLEQRLDLAPSDRH
ncbi:MAG: hypothetical protein KGM15_05380 [Pseudomonadota bacterium]|nr:hypothetical protein [Pseudomonadota bacterium]